MDDSTDKQKTTNTAGDLASARERSPASDGISTAEREELEKVETERSTTAVSTDNVEQLNVDEIQGQLSRTTAALTREKAKHRSKPGMVLLLAVLMALLGAIAGIVIYKGYFANPTTPSSPIMTPSTPSAATSTDPTAENLVADAKGTLKSAIVPTTFDDNGYAMSEDNLGAFTIPLYRPAGYDFYTVPEKYYGVTAAANDEKTSDADIVAVRSFLDSHKLAATSTAFDLDNATISSTDYFGQNIICRDSQTKFTYKAGNYQINFACADTKSYATNAKNLTPLYTAYKASKTDAATIPGLALGLGVINPSKTTGYQFAHITMNNIYTPVGGSVALFYQTPDKTWHYFTNTQNTMLCSAYNTSDIKKAFLGETCGTEDGKSGIVAL